MGILVLRLFWPSDGLYKKTKNPLFDYFMGIELYPHITPVISLKLWITSRFGIMLWQYVMLLCWKANFETLPDGVFNYSLSATTLLQTIYITKFYYWEEAYNKGFDVTECLYGFYFCWGSIAFMPGFFTITSLYLVDNSPYDAFGIKSFITVIIGGIISIGLNTWADEQKLYFRSNNGKCIIWGKPAKLIRAEYIDDFGQNKRNILLTSGFWGISRHMNYLFEFMLNLLWCLPALFASPIPYMCLIFVTGFLFDRCNKNEEKCKLKYGHYWQQYTNQILMRMCLAKFIHRYEFTLAQEPEL
ncbi:unnamed protein product, partial [Medioppia subpectinata]